MTDSKLDTVIFPVTNLTEAVSFYQSTLRLGNKFTDGDRYAALDAGGVTFALAGPQENVLPGHPSVCFRVSSVNETIDRLVENGATIAVALARGHHETRATLRDPWGNQFVIYSTAARDEKADDDAH